MQDPGEPTADPSTATARTADPLERIAGAPTTPWAVVTGASRGIGADLALELARRGYNILLVARDSAALEGQRERLKAASAVETRTLPLDLGRSDAPQAVLDHCRQHALAVEVLVNNAGFGDMGRVANRPFSVYRDMIALNLESLVELTSLFIGPMVESRRGYVLNVASTAAFQPVPNFAVYAASKAFILSFTEALHEELKGTGVFATTLCPGLTDTDFHARANTRSSRLMRLPMMTPERVAKVGVDGLFRGKAVVVPGLMNRLMLQGLRVTPRSIARSMALRMMSPRDLERPPERP